MNRSKTFTAPGIRLAALFITLIVTAFAASPQINTDQVMNVGRNAMYFDDYVLSIQYFNQAISAKPYLARPYLYRAIAKINLDDYRGAEADATMALDRNPFITDAWEVRGVARQQLGNYRGAVEDYTEALRLLPHNRQISFNLATAQTEAGMYAAADSTFAEVMKAYPSFENGLLGRARLRLLQADTVRAEEDIRGALKINRNSFNAHAMLSDLAMRGAKPDVDSAMVHLDAAIKLQPHYAGLYVNRAYLKYRKDDWFGAMNDYDYALQLDPLNRLALFNRGLLEMESSAFDRAFEDMDRVLQMDPDDMRARYNRAVIYSRKHDFRNAIADINHVIEAYPEFPNVYMMRSEWNRSLGNLKAAMADYDKGRALLRSLKPENLPGFGMAGNDGDETAEGAKPAGNAAKGKDNTRTDADEKMTKAQQLMAQRQFAQLLTVSDNTDFRDEYNNSDIRGRVQDRNVTITAEPMVELSFYSSPTEVRPNTYYIKEVNDLNATRALRMNVVVTTHAPQLNDEEMIGRHFKSIKYYNSYLATHTPRAIDYIGRALDLITVRDYVPAVADLDRAIALTPDFAAAYLLRAQANRHRMATVDSEETPSATGAARPAEGIRNHGVRQRNLSDAVLADLDKVIELSPSNPFAWYNKGCLLLERGDLDGARNAFGRAIEIKPDFGEAYFNRGYVSLTSGNRREGIADLSRAGELGIVSAYNLMKRLGAD